MQRRPMSYEEELGELQDEMDQLARESVVRDFLTLGESAGIDIISEILDKGKSSDQVFDAIRAKLS